MYLARRHWHRHFYIRCNRSMCQIGAVGSQCPPRGTRGLECRSHRRPEVTRRRRRDPRMGRRGAGSSSPHRRGPRAAHPPRLPPPRGPRASPQSQQQPTSGATTQARDTKTGSALLWLSARDSPSPLRPAPSRAQAANQRPGSSPCHRPPPASADAAEPGLRLGAGTPARGGDSWRKGGAP